MSVMTRMISPALQDTDEVLLTAGLVSGLGVEEVVLLQSSSRSGWKVMEVTA